MAAALLLKCCICAVVLVVFFGERAEGFEQEVSGAHKCVARMFVVRSVRVTLAGCYHREALFNTHVRGLRHNATV